MQTVRAKVIQYCHHEELQDPVNYQRENVMLFIPWRDEKKELIHISISDKFQWLNDKTEWKKL
jgi:hypothetical protein